jgi:hypothetical protein
MKDVLEKYCVQHQRCKDDVISLINIVLDNYSSDNKFKQILVNLEKYKSNLEWQTSVFEKALSAENIEEDKLNKLKYLIDENEVCIKNLYDTIKEA